MTRGLAEVQDIVEYRFRSISLLMLALTAAGADHKVYDGNRKMAQLGESLIELLLAENAFTAGCSRGETRLRRWSTKLLTFASWCEQENNVCCCKNAPREGRKGYRYRSVHKVQSTSRRQPAVSSCFEFSSQCGCVCLLVGLGPK